MQCPSCGSPQTRVTSTFNHGTVMQRYRLCKICGHRWKAWEESDPTPVRVKRPSGSVASDLFGKSEGDRNE